MKCQKCGSELRDSAKFCDNCGAAVEIKKLCPKCGNIVDSNVIYCPFCNSTILEKKPPKSKLADVEGLKNDFIKCPKCGSEYKSTTPYCPNCGEKTAAVPQTQPNANVAQSSDDHLKNYIEFKKCPNCSEINDSKALFCKKCNQSLSDVPIDTKEKLGAKQSIRNKAVLILVIILVIIVFIAIFCGSCNKCNSSKSSSFEPTTVNYEPPTTEYILPTTEYVPPTIEMPTEPPTEIFTEEPTTQMTDALHELYNDDRITLSFYQIHDYEYDPNESRIEFLAENKTDKNLTIQSDLVSINGISYKGNMSGQVLPHTKGIIEMRFDQKIPVDMPSSIGMKISYFDGILGDTIDENEIVIPETKIQ